VKTYARGVDGALMDNIIDYFTYVVVPALFLIEAELVPAALALPCAISILLTSAYQFSQVDAKTDESHEYYFKGFPDFWNVLVVYMLVLELNPVLNFIFFVIFNILIFVPIKYIYPTRTIRLKKLTMGLSVVFGILALAGLILYPNEPKWIWWASLLYGVYYVGLSLWPKKKTA
jgi:phosphatidylcholine synthase